MLKSVSDMCSMCVLQGTEEKGLCTAARPAETLGLVLGTGTNDIGPLEGGDWPAWQDRTRRVKR